MNQFADKQLALWSEIVEIHWSLDPATFPPKNPLNREQSRAGRVFRAWMPSIGSANRLVNRTDCRHPLAVLWPCSLARSNWHLAGLVHRNIRSSQRCDPSNLISFHGASIIRTAFPRIAKYNPMLKIRGGRARVDVELTNNSSGQWPISRPWVTRRGSQLHAAHAKLKERFFYSWQVCRGVKLYFSLT